MQASGHNEPWVCPKWKQLASKSQWHCHFLNTKSHTRPSSCCDRQIIARALARVIDWISLDFEKLEEKRSNLY